MPHDPIRFVLALHNHQPVGNFGWTIEQAYQDSYLPFLDVFSQEKYASLKISLHHSGCLTDWLDEHHPEYLDRLAELTAAGRVEILGGTYYEAILGMLPSRDRIGQIQRFSQWLEKRLGANVRGMWMPERVWEASFAQDLAKAGIQYTIVDDFHLKKAGLRDEQLYGYVATEDDGAVVGVFPGSENLRYWIPFHDPQQTVDYCKKIREKHPQAILVFGDDGEKFGTWPGTHEHVYTNGWLESFFDALLKNRKDIRMVTMAEACDEVKPLQKLYIPDCSYREMTEWSLPASRLAEYDRAVHEIPSEDPLWKRLKTFITGGNWRNFKVKYPETNEMYARMMAVSSRLAATETLFDSPPAALQQKLDAARAELYRGQCNCSYWHGAFGGVYLPVLRDAVYSHLISADMILDEISLATETPRPPISLAEADYDFDLHKEFRVQNGELAAWLSPWRGGTLYELDVLRVRHNLLATLARREEAYHRKIATHDHSQNFGSIHERVVFKQEGLEKRLQYDTYPRKSLADLFFLPGTTLERLHHGDISPACDFANHVYDVKTTLSGNVCEVTLSCRATAPTESGRQATLRVAKVFTMRAAETKFRVRYILEDLPPDEVFHFGTELHFAGMPARCDDRYFYQWHTPDTHEIPRQLGHLGRILDLVDTHHLGLKDEWLRLDARLTLSRPGRIWACPVETVSNSEGGFELIHQSVAVTPNWFLQGDVNGRWEVELTLDFPPMPALNK